MTCNLSVIRIGASRNSRNGFKNIQQMYHPSPDRSLHASISCYIYSTQKHRNGHEVRILNFNIVHGLPQKILADNAYEFASNQYTTMCDYLGIMLQTTAAESPWSNRIYERSNQTLANMLDKITADTKCSLDLVLC